MEEVVDYRVEVVMVLLEVEHLINGLVLLEELERIMAEVVEDIVLKVELVVHMVVEVEVEQKVKNMILHGEVVEDLVVLMAAVAVVEVVILDQEVMEVNMVAVVEVEQVFLDTNIQVMEGLAVLMVEVVE